MCVLKEQRPRVDGRGSSKPERLGQILRDEQIVGGSLELILNKRKDAVFGVFGG